MTRLIMIGIDGMDPLVFEKYRSALPALDRLSQAGIYRHSRSVFPPDSVPAWVTIFTGEHPANHGWLDNIDYEDIRKGAKAYNADDLRGRTFWDLLSQQGKRVCVINPFLAYPAWPVNGVMASGPVFISGKKDIYPKELEQRFALPEFGGMTDFPAENHMEAFLKDVLQSTRELAQFGLEMLAQEPWDLFFITFFTLDRVQHFFWRYSDPSDPCYPGPSKREGAILEAYLVFDQIIGQFMQKMDPGVGLAVFSDHGHGMRPTMLLNLNEMLRKCHLLQPYGGANPLAQSKKIVEVAKNISIRVVGNVLGEQWLYRVGRLLPKKTRRALKKSDYIIDKERSTAWASEMGGGASVGGVVINPALLGFEYQKAVEKVLAVLDQANHLTGEQVVRWARPREGERFYPDVIFELDPRYAVGRSLFCPFVEANPRHKTISGGHKSEGVWFACNLPEEDAQVHSVSEVYQTVLSLFKAREAG